MESLDKERKYEIYNNFYMNYRIAIIESMRDKGVITEEMFINACNKFYKKYGSNKYN